MGDDPEKEMLVALARALAPAPEHFVVIGGAAQHLFRHVHSAQAVGFPALRTSDADVAVSTTIGTAIRLDSQMAAQGFHEEVGGLTTPPVARYVFGTKSDRYVEFVTHRTGSGDARGRQASRTETIAGALAQRLPHIDVLLKLPWTIELLAADGYCVGEERLHLRIANAASYIAQKLLILRKRDEDNRAKDLVYVHDTLLIFAPALEQLAELWRSVESPHSKTARDVARIARSLGASVTDDTRRAAQLLGSLSRPGRSDEQGFLNALDEGLTRVFPS
jgi:hypothetical protein